MKRNTLTKILIVLLIATMFPACDDEGKKGAVGPITKISMSAIKISSTMDDATYTWYTLTTSGTDLIAISDGITVAWGTEEAPEDPAVFNLTPAVQESEYFAVQCASNEDKAIRVVLTFYNEDDEVIDVISNPTNGHDVLVFDDLSSGDYYDEFQLDGSEVRYNLRQID